MKVQMDNKRWLQLLQKFCRNALSSAPSSIKVKTPALIIISWAPNQKCQALCLELGEKKEHVNVSL